MGVSPTRQNGTRSDRFASKFDKKKRNKLQKDATTEIREAKQKLRKNIHSYSWWSKFIQLASIIVFYFSSSIALTFYQKDLLKVRKNELNNQCSKAYGRYQLYKGIKEINNTCFYAVTSFIIPHLCAF